VGVFIALAFGREMPPMRVIFSTVTGNIKQARGINRSLVGRN
jgi:hypothetical protein